jgi:hypothetical protein
MYTRTVYGEGDLTIKTNELLYGQESCLRAMERHYTSGSILADSVLTYVQFQDTPLGHEQLRYMLAGLLESRGDATTDNDPSFRAPDIDEIVEHFSNMNPTIFIDNVDSNLDDILKRGYLERAGVEIEFVETEELVPLSEDNDDTSGYEST